MNDPRNIVILAHLVKVTTMADGSPRIILDTTEGEGPRIFQAQADKWLTVGKHLTVTIVPAEDLDEGGDA